MPYVGHPHNTLTHEGGWSLTPCCVCGASQDSFQHQRIHPRMGLIRPSYVNGGTYSPCGRNTHPAAPASCVWWPAGLMLRAEGMPDTFVPLVGPKDAGAKLRTVRVWDTKFTGAVDQVAAQRSAVYAAALRVDSSWWTIAWCVGRCRSRLCVPILEDV